MSDTQGHVTKHQHMNSYRLIVSVRAGHARRDLNSEYSFISTSLESTLIGISVLVEAGCRQ